MNVNGIHFRSIWLHKSNPEIVQIIDQRNLPHEFNIEDLTTVDDVISAIRDMHVRGAGLIGAAAGFGMYLAALEAVSKSDPYKYVMQAGLKLKTARPTAINLAAAVERQLNSLSNNLTVKQMISYTLNIAQAIADEDAQACYQIGIHGLELINNIAKQNNGEVINILTHCNAGWLAFVDHGSATAPIYAAHDAGIRIHVWVDETRPRNQGARLTAWELEQHGVPFTIIPDNAGGHLMQHNLVDLVLVGSDRTTYTGDVANKIGTYLKALAAKDTHVPFYVALPSSTFDWNLHDGILQIPIEERGADEVKTIQGLAHNKLTTVLLTTPTSNASNFAFDITPSRLITGLITERGICEPNQDAIFKLFPEKHKLD
ncbi:S-methyl-5-thioribose-1-phosphate isomerase [bacterium]|nr:S-methyl-5-thioribose-1-phosphate isomerase [bacterium]